MKTIYKTLFACLTMASLLSSCFDFDEMNHDPNNPTETSPELLLTTACWDMFSEHDNFQMESRMLVQTDGESSAQYYKWTRGNFDNYNQLRQLQKMEEEANRINSKAYLAIAKCLKAVHFYNLTLQFGDIPFSEALQGESAKIHAPTYDSQEKVLEGILSLLKEADELLENNNEIISGDVINKGNLIKWQKFANAFRLKVLITLSKRLTVGQLTIKNEFASIVNNRPLMESIEEQSAIAFLDQSGSRYPNFNSSSFGSGLYMDSTFVKQLTDRKDPRVIIYCTQTPNAQKAGKDIDDYSSYEGGNPIVQYSKINEKAVAGNISKPNERYYKEPICEEMMLLGYPEQQFIIAEAIVRGWISGNEKTEYSKGIKGSFAFLANQNSTIKYAEYLSEVACENYLKHDLVNLDKASSKEEKINYIITQKYLQLYFQTNNTTFYDNLRTGYPEFITAQGVSVPTRWMYPQREYDYNQENVTEAIESQFGGDDAIQQTPWYLN